VKYYASFMFLFCTAGAWYHPPNPGPLNQYVSFMLALLAAYWAITAYGAWRKR
jgi:hypothetical protein